MSRQTDSQIFGVILLAAAFWIAIFYHDEVQKWIHHVWVVWLGR